VHLNIILPPIPTSSQSTLTYGAPYQNPVNTSPLTHSCHISGPHYPHWLDHPNYIRWRIHEEGSSSLCSLIHNPTSFLLGLNILNTLFSKSLSPCSSLNFICKTVLMKNFRKSTWTEKQRMEFNFNI
jgi:hypothetical protein